MSWFPGAYPFENIPYSGNFLVDDHEGCKRQLDIANEDRAGLQARLCEQLADSYQQEMLQQRDAQEKLRQEYLHQAELLAIAKDQNEKLLASWNAAKGKHENEKEEYAEDIAYLTGQLKYFQGQSLDMAGKRGASQQEYNDLKAKYSDLNVQYSGLNAQYSDLMAQHSDLQAQYSNARDAFTSTQVANDEMKRRCDVLRADLDQSRKQYQVLEASQMQKCQVIEETKGSLIKEVEQGKKLADDNKLLRALLHETLQKGRNLNEKYLSVCEENDSSRKEHLRSIAELQTERNRVRVFQKRLELGNDKYSRATEQILQLRCACEYLEAKNEELTRELEGFEHVGEDEDADESEEDYSAEGAWQLRDCDDEEEVTAEASSQEAEGVAEQSQSQSQAEEEGASYEHVDEDCLCDEEYEEEEEEEEEFESIEPMSK